MKNRKRKKLSLSRTRIRTLSSRQLDGVDGGAFQTDLRCSSLSRYSAICAPSDTICTHAAAQDTCY